MAEPAGAGGAGGAGGTDAPGAGAASGSARAALAGNPSDGYSGAVLAVTIDALSACVELGAGAPSDDLLTAATLRRFAREFGADTSAHSPQLSTTIPRSVGMGGSSAIVIATLRALGARHHISLDPDSMAALALSIEVDDLGIAAGMQDRLVQCHGGLVFMEFAGVHPHAERLDPGLLPPLVVAWREDHSEHSGVVHSDLRERFRRGEPGVREAMAQLGGLARRARAALLSGAQAGFRAAVDATFDLRRELMDLDPRHVELVEIGRRAGAAVNYTGSGGAVVCVCNDPGHRDAVARELQEGGAETVATEAATG
jgi:glucuronokinase